MTDTQQAAAEDPSGRGSSKNSDVAQKLLPCPFCGEEAEFERLGMRRSSCIVKCLFCGCRVETSETGEACGRNWNTRRGEAAAEQRGAEREREAAYRLMNACPYCDKNDSGGIFPCVLHGGCERAQIIQLPDGTFTAICPSCGHDCSRARSAADASRDARLPPQPGAPQGGTEKEQQ